MKKLLIPILFAFICNSASSQESVAEFQFINVETVCSDGQICWDIQVRAITANGADGAIELADVNYRFFYPNNIMTFASVEGLVGGYFPPSLDEAGPLGDEQLDLFGEAFEGTDGLGFVDFTIQVDGNGNATALNGDWLSTAKVCFNPVDPIAVNPDGTSFEFCTPIVWSIPSYNGTANYYRFAYITATEVIDGGGSGISELSEEVIHWQWTEAGPNTIAGTCIDFDCAILPTELLNFVASLKNENETNVNWITASEINSDYYQIERKSDVEETFQAIARENGAGSSFSEISYEYIDRLPAKGNTFYYRLKMVDQDGSFEYSDIKSVQREGEKSRLNAYPNPTTRYVNVDFEVPGNNKPVEIFIYDSTAKSNSTLLLNKVMDEGNFIEKLDLNDFSAGYYFIQLNIDGVTESIPLQIIK